MGLAINPGATFVADAHAAQGLPAVAPHRETASRTGLEDGGGHRHSGMDAHWPAIQMDDEGLSIWHKSSRVHRRNRSYCLLNGDLINFRVVRGVPSIFYKGN
jgi:hypothetical protein